MKRWLAALGLVALGTSPSLALADVVALADNGFVVRQTSEVDADAGQVWVRLIKPADWWSGTHTFAGEAANLSLDSRPGGCFCEVLPATEGKGAPRGGVEHMRVVYVEDGRALRMAGGLGPLQSEAVNATMTVTLKPLDGGGSRVLMEYVVGGFMRYKTGQIAPAVDKVLGEQLKRLVSTLGERAMPQLAPASGERTANSEGAPVGR